MGKRNTVRSNSATPPNENISTITPVGLASWEGGFALAQVTRFETIFDGLRLFHFRKPVRHKGKVYSYAIECIETGEDKMQVRRIKQRYFLRVKSKAQAQKLFHQLAEEFKARRKSIEQASAAQQESAELQKTKTAIDNAKLAYLARGYPKTIQKMKAKTSVEEIYWAFVEEVAKVSGGHLITAIPTAELVKKIAAHWLAQKKRKNQEYFDPVE